MYARYQFPGFGEKGKTVYQLFMVYEQDARVGFQVDPLGFAHYFESLDGDVLFVGEAEADEVKHSGPQWRSRYFEAKQVKTGGFEACASTISD